MSLSIIVHHARNTRPQWYKNYHKWKYSEVLHWTVLVISIPLLILGSINLIFYRQAIALTTTITQEIFPSALEISAPSFIFFSSIVSNSITEQISKGTLQTLTILNRRGTDDVGWSVTATCTDFTAINQPFLQYGIHDTVSSNGTYNDSHGGTYIISIVSSGNVGVAKFVVDGLETQKETVTGNSVHIGTHGVSISFAPAEYVAGESWLVRVDTIPVNNLTIIPQNVSGSEGIPRGVTIGGEHTFLNSNDPMTIMTASTGHPTETFFVDLLLQLRIPPRTYANKYTATFIVTSA